MSDTETPPLATCSRGSDSLIAQQGTAYLALMAGEGWLASNEEESSEGRGKQLPHVGTVKRRPDKMAEARRIMQLALTEMQKRKKPQHKAVPSYHPAVSSTWLSHEDVAKRIKQKHCRIIRKWLVLKREVSKHLEEFGEQAGLLQTVEKDSRLVKSLLLSDENREAAVEDILASCRSHPELRGALLGAVRELFDSQVLQTASSYFTNLIPEDPNNAQALVVARAPRSREHAGWQALADSFQQLHGQPPKEVLKAVKANAVKGSCVVDYKADGSWSLELAPDNAQKKRKITKDMEDEGGNKKIHR